MWVSSPFASKSEYIEKIYVLIMRRIFYSLFFLVATCGGNSMEEFGTANNSLQSVTHQALIYLNAGNYAAAISYITSQDGATQNNQTVREMLGEAYLGMCGFNFVDFYTNFSASGAPSAFFAKLMYAFKGKTVDPSYCQLAQTTIELLPSTNSNKSLLLLNTGMAKIGTVLKSHLDTNNDGLIDAALSRKYCPAAVGNSTIATCTNNNGACGLKKDMRYVITGFGLIIMNFTGVINSLLGDSSLSATLTSVNSTCEAAVGGGGAGSCSITDPSSASLTANFQNSFRIILDDANTFGFGNTAHCNLSAADVASCCL
jgi:hypothetical protein